MTETNNIDDLLMLYGLEVEEEQIQLSDSEIELILTEELETL